MGGKGFETLDFGSCQIFLTGRSCEPYDVWEKVRAGNQGQRQKKKFHTQFKFGVCKLAKTT